MTGELPGWAVRLKNFLLFRWRRAQMNRDLEEEIRFHLEQAAEPADMGNIALAKEECWEIWSFMRLERLLQDLRFAFRMYGRTPVFTGIAVLSLALGIGGNAAMLCLVNSLLLRPLPYSQPERLVRITGIYPRAALPFFQTRTRSLEIASVSRGTDFNLTGRGPAMRVRGSVATANFLSVFGTAVAIGRSFTAEEQSPKQDGVVILSHSLWKDHYGGDASIIGRVIRLDGVGRRVIGVMPAGFDYPTSTTQLWIPMRLDSTNFLEYWGTEFMPMIGRLRPPATIGAAQREIGDLVPQFRRTFPYPMARDFNAASTAIPLQQDIVGSIRGKLLMLLGAVALVLLIACANVASLLLSRATTRRSELAMRAALGAGQIRIVRQLLTESVGIALAGAALGILLGASALSIFKSVLPPTLPGLSQARIDWEVVAGAALLALLAGVMAGLAPALSASRVNLLDAIRTGGQRATSGFWANMRSLILAVEVAMTLVLLVGAGLLMRSLYLLSETHPGFDASHVLTVAISPEQSFCSKRPACVGLYDRVLLRAQQLSGVREVAIANTVPVDGQLPTFAVDVEGHPKSADHPAPLFWLGAVSPEYFRALRIPLLEGRLLSRSDGAGAAPVVVISASTARNFWPGESAVGKHVRAAGEQNWRTVVGVVADVHQFMLSKGMPDSIPGAVYMPYAQSTNGNNNDIPAAMILLARVEGDGASVSAELRRLAEEQAADAPVGRVQRLEEIVAGSIADFRSTMRVFLSFAAAAMLLAAIGIYGLMSYWVNQRTYEIGLRVAIGATRPGIVSLIMAQGIRVTLYGVAAGIVLALALTRFLGALLYGVSAMDAMTFVLGIGVVIAVAIFATAFPAWRAARIDPVKALRSV